MTQFGLVPAANNRRPSAGPNRSRRPQQTQFQSQLKPQQSSSSSSSFQNQLDPFALHETRHEIDTKMGFARYKEGPGRLGWLVNLQETLVEDPEWETGRAAVDFYFIQETGETFKSTIVESPYFLIACKVALSLWFVKCTFDADALFFVSEKQGTWCRGISTSQVWKDDWKDCARAKGRFGSGSSVFMSVLLLFMLIL